MTKKTNPTQNTHTNKSLLTLGVPLRLIAGAELDDGLVAGHRYSNMSTPGPPPCWRSRDPESKATLLVLLLRRRPTADREGTSTRMATRPVPSTPGPGGTLQRRTVCDTISDFVCVSGERDAFEFAVAFIAETTVGSGNGTAREGRGGEGGVRFVGIRIYVCCIFFSSRGWCVQPSARAVGYTGAGMKQHSHTQHATPRLYCGTSPLSAVHVKFTCRTKNKALRCSLSSLCTYLTYHMYVRLSCLRSNPNCPIHD